MSREKERKSAGTGDQFIKLGLGSSGYSGYSGFGGGRERNGGARHVAEEHVLLATGARSTEDE